MYNIGQEKKFSNNNPDIFSIFKPNGGGVNFKKKILGGSLKFFPGNSF